MSAIDNLEKIRPTLPRNKSKTPRRIGKPSKTPKRRVRNCRRTPRRRYNWQFSKENKKQSVTPIRLSNKDKHNLKSEL